MTANEPFSNYYCYYYIDVKKLISLNIELETKS